MTSDIIAEARRWIGTPYRHQASTLGAGCDCLGLLRGIWRETRGAEPEVAPAYTADWAEPQAEETLLAAAMRHLQPICLRDAAPGDVLVFRMTPASIAKHVGILSAVAPGAFIHAYSGKGVVESPLSAPWAAKIAASFRFPERSA